MAIGLLATAGLLTAVPAAAAPLGFRECFADTGGPCHKTPHRSLELATDVAVSPDGTSVYVAAGKRELPTPGADSITEFAREASGRLHRVGCLTFGGARGCRASGAPLEGVGRLAISPDGRDLYAVSTIGIVEFARGTGGRLRPIGCVAFGPRWGRGTSGCARPGSRAQLGVTGLAISPDGADIYVTAGSNSRGVPRGEWVGRIYEFARRADGTLAAIGCLGPAGEPGCATAGTAYLDEPVVSPDGSALYALGEDSIERFPRAADGSLGAPECVLAGRYGCDRDESIYTSVAIDPDGSRLYLGTIHETAAYSIASTGALTKLAATPIPSFRLALSPDGSRLYGAVYDTGHGGISTFATGDGTLSRIGRPFPVEGVEHLTVTPDGGTLLAASFVRSSLLVLATGPIIRSTQGRKDLP